MLPEELHDRAKLLLHDLKIGMEDESRTAADELDCVKMHLAGVALSEREYCAELITGKLTDAHSDVDEPGDPNGCAGFCESFGCGTLRKLRDKMLHPMEGGEK